MCGRYTIAGVDGVRRWMPPGFTERLDPRGWFRARWNVAPTQLVPAIRGKGKELELFRWGLIPAWASDEKIGYSMINARAETVAEKPAFKKLIATQRCLIPADGFYEWRKEGKKKTPMYATVDGGEVFAFAGLWDAWQNARGERVESCTIITTPPNALMTGIHDRMPAILPREAYAAWIGETAGPEELLQLLKPFPAERMTVRPVCTLVNSVKNEGPELLGPFVDTETGEVQGELF
ncbi:MAG: SOS response-associated peptidase [Phycisphaerae bacterium]